MTQPHVKVKNEANRPSSLEIWTDIGYVAACKKATEHYVEFNVYVTSGTNEDGSQTLQSSDTERYGFTNNIDEAEVFLSGDIKWDGCSNWSFYPADNCMAHFCSKKQAAELGTLLERLYDLAAELMNSPELQHKNSRK